MLEAEYAQRRRVQKANGLRFPSHCDATPRLPARWHGDERIGARHTLELGRRSSGAGFAGHQVGGTVQLVASRALDGDLDHDLDALHDALDWARQQLHVICWEADATEYRVAMDVQRLLGQVYLLTYGPPPIAQPWHFRPPRT